MFIACINNTVCFLYGLHFAGEGRLNVQVSQQTSCSGEHLIQAAARRAWSQVTVQVTKLCTRSGYRDLETVRAGRKTNVKSNLATQRQIFNGASDWIKHDQAADQTTTNYSSHLQLHSERRVAYFHVQFSGAGLENVCLHSDGSAVSTPPGVAKKSRSCLESKWLKCC